MICREVAGPLGLAGEALGGTDESDGGLQSRGLGEGRGPHWTALMWTTCLARGIWSSSGVECAAATGLVSPTGVQDDVVPVVGGAPGEGVTKLVVGHPVSDCLTWD